MLNSSQTSSFAGQRIILFSNDAGAAGRHQKLEIHAFLDRRGGILLHSPGLIAEAS